MNEKTLKWSISVIVIFWITFLLMNWAILRPSLSEKEEANGIKLDNCIKYMQQAIPDPNDTEARSNFLKQCYERN